MDDRSGQATILTNLGVVYSALGNKQEALRCYTLALSLRQHVEDRGGELIIRYNTAMVYIDTRHLAEAVTELEQVVAIEEAVSHSDLASDRATLAQVRAMLADKKDTDAQA